jgi:cyanophycinase
MVNLDFMIPKSNSFRLSLLVIIVFLSGCGGLKQSDKPEQAYSSCPENGYLIAAGGNLTDTAVFKKFIELAGGADASVVIITTAATDEELADGQFYTDQEKRFRSYGFTNFSFMHTRDPKEASTEAFFKPLIDVHGVWILGGRQWRLVDAYEGTQVFDQLLKLLERGGVIGGSSAGASILASYLARGDTQTNTAMMGDHEKGFGFFDNTAIDQHLLAMNRQFDIFEILDTHPGMLGLGLDENTAIVAHGNQFEVIGKSYVAVYDRTFYREVRDKDDWNHKVGEVSHLPEGSRKFYLLKAGQKYDMYNRRVIE